ncbi:hypothetical protein B0H16DRAFT_498034 [Mycena metata]|uniref:Uncharacterized protein n=1 Tax=Mycena metata TaxID=1033252 RepID=A0AAD7MFZ9_9AGAR|nr:hypothetical protein B0H16DRAFT_498034 [Mycena metata]
MDLGMGMGIDTTDFGLFNPFQFTFEAPFPLPLSESESGGSTGSFSPVHAPRVRRHRLLHLHRRPRRRACKLRPQERGPRPRRADRSDPQYHPPAHPTPLHPRLPLHPSHRVPRPAQPRDPSPDRNAITAKDVPHDHRAPVPHQLNARIQSLRQAVPALRIVDRTAAIKAGEPYPGGDASDPEDHIDARGFINGVKIARKCLKRKVVPLPASAAASASTNSSHAAPAGDHAPPARPHRRPHGDTSSAHSRSSRSSQTPTSLLPLPFPLPTPTPNLHRARPHTGGHRGQGVRGRGDGGQDGPAAGVPPPRERGGVGERRVARGEGRVGAVPCVCVPFPAYFVGEDEGGREGGGGGGERDGDGWGALDGECGESV